MTTRRGGSEPGPRDRAYERPCDDDDRDDDRDVRRSGARRRDSAGRPSRDGERTRRAPIAAMRAARLGRHYINEMTAKDPEEVTALERTEDGGWQVDVQVVETRRIPDSTDILAVYRAELDANGELLSYRRIRRYARCQVQEG